MILNTKITGAEKIKPLLDQLAKKVKNKALRKAGNKAMLPMVEILSQAVVDAGLVDSGNLKSSFGVNTKWKGRGNLVTSVGPVSYAGLNSRERKKIRLLRSAFYARFLETGTKHIYARHFMQKAARREQAQLITRYTEYVGTFAQEEIDKLKVST